jgi:anti-anti-sigma factor
MPERLPFTIRVARVGPDADVTIAGDLDIIALPALTGALARLRGTTPGSLALHLAGVDFIDCGCARAITAACQAWPGPGQAVIRDASPIVHRVFQVTGLAAAAHMDGPGITIPRQAAPGGEQGDGDGVGPSQLAARLGTPLASLYRARELGLLPKPGMAGRWPPDTADGIARRWPQTAAAVEAARDLGAARSATLLARLTGLPVTAAHIPELAARGLLASPRRYKNRPMYRVSDLHAAATDPIILGLLTHITTPVAAPGQLAGPPDVRSQPNPAPSRRTPSDQARGPG